MIASAGAIWALGLGYADAQSRLGTREAISRATRAAPGDAGYLAQFSVVAGSGPEAAAYLRKAVVADPYYSWAWIQLGLTAELDGDVAQAERYLLRAADVDRQFSPRWALCDFYFRQANIDRFWLWARNAVSVQEADPRPVYRLAWRVTPDAAVILDRAGARGLLKFLLEEHPLEAAATVMEQLQQASTPEQTPLLLAYTEKLLENGRVSASVKVWNGLCDRRLVPFKPFPADGRPALTNADFSSRPSSSGFDWQWNTVAGIDMVDDPTPGEFALRLSGLQPDKCTIMSQRVPMLQPGPHEFRFNARMTGGNAQEGLRWKICQGPCSGAVLAESPSLAQAEWVEQRLVFSSDTPGWITLSLDFQRPRGHTRLSGVVSFAKLSMDPGYTP